MGAKRQDRYKFSFGAPPSLISSRNFGPLPVPQVALRPLEPSSDSSIRTTRKSDRNARCRPVTEGEGKWNRSQSEPQATSSVSLAIPLGFKPQESLVCITRADNHVGPTLRVDLPKPSTESSYAQMVAGYLGHVTSAEGVLFAVYTHDGRWDREPWIAASTDRLSPRNRLLGKDQAEVMYLRHHSPMK